MSKRGKGTTMEQKCRGGVECLYMECDAVKVGIEY
jgi:hypothetical protein